MRKADDTGWVARRNAAQLEVRDVGGGVLEMYDGKGLRYSFSSAPSGAGQPLDHGNYYLLQDVFGPGGTQVHLTYTFGAPSRSGGSRAFPSISPASVTITIPRAHAPSIRSVWSMIAMHPRRCR